MNIYITRNIPKPALDLIRKECGPFQINSSSKGLSRKELLAKVKGRDGILCLLTDIIDKDVLDAAGKNLKVVSNCAVGYDNIDVAAATRLGIAVTNTPGVLTAATAEMAWALLLSAARRIPESDRYTRAGKFKGWDPHLLLGRNVYEKTLGIVGAGRIGSRVASMAGGFKMKVLYHSRSANPEMERESGARKVPMDQLLKESDFVSLHVNLSPDTRRLIGKRELDLMKPTAILINTSRGPIVDEKALVSALKRKKIFAAGLDVYEHEPKLSPGLQGCENAVLAPHLASATLETRTQMALLAAQNLAAALKGARPGSIVNPEVLEQK